MGQSGRSGVVGWPLPALAVWVLAWAAHIYMQRQGWGPLWAFLLPMDLGILAAVWAARRGQSRARQALLVAGFPVSWLLLALPSVTLLPDLPAWLWLVALGGLLCLYPLRSWRDAPVFPTPWDALRELPVHIPLPSGTRVLDAGCGAGDGLRALRLAYPEALLTGVEFSRPLSWVARWRCPWAQVWCADMWAHDWSPYGLVYLFQRPESMARAWQKACQDMAPGAWLVSLEFPVLGLVPYASLVVGEVDAELARTEDSRHVWLYQVPLGVADGS